MSDRIDRTILSRFPGQQPNAVAYRQALTNACVEFVDRGLADMKFTDELSSDVDAKFWSCISEALIAERLRDKIFPHRDAVGIGPDLLVLDGDQRIWIEVICPESNGISEEWTDSALNEVVDFPNEQILLRWTSAIKEKANKLLGKNGGQKNGYLASGVVAPDDAYVIAVNGCQLRGGVFPELFGISQFLFAAEAVFPLGARQLVIDRKSHKTVSSGHQYRPYVLNKNGSQVPADTFLDLRYAPISAIWAVDLKGEAAIGNIEPIAVVHNPNAVNPVRPGFLPADHDYVATDEGNGYVISRLSPSPC